MEEKEYQTEVVRRLIRVAFNANALLGKLGTRENPVDPKYEEEFIRLELAVSDLYNFIKKEDVRKTERRA